MSVTARIGALGSAAVLLAFAVSALSEGGPPPPPPPRSIPGITADDPFPGGCVDCHIVLPASEGGRDMRISTLLGKAQEGVEEGSAPEGKSLRGKHPKIPPALLAEIPGGCSRCHRDDSKTAPPLGRLIHRVHLTGGEANHFMTLFQGECTFCHKLDRTTGEWSLPSGPEH